MEYFIQQLINGITLGSIYGLIAIGYTMVYGIIGMINFAHGDIFMIGAFIALIAFIGFVQQSNAQAKIEFNNDVIDYGEIAKGSDGVRLGKDPETGITLLDEDPDWVWSREDAAGNYIELRLNKEYGYVLNITQGDYEIIDYELGGVENAITINQIQ